MNKDLILGAHKTTNRALERIEEIESSLWEAADQLRANSKLTSSEYVQASKDLLASLRELLAPLERWTEKEQTQAEVETFILDALYTRLPAPPFIEKEIQEIAHSVYEHVWQQSANGSFTLAA